jgi:hypothetical protein
MPIKPAGAGDNSSEWAHKFISFSLRILYFYGRCPPGGGAICKREWTRLRPRTGRRYGTGSMAASCEDFQLRGLPEEVSPLREGPAEKGLAWWERMHISAARYGS